MWTPCVCVFCICFVSFNEIKTFVDVCRSWLPLYDLWDTCPSVCPCLGAAQYNGHHFPVVIVPEAQGLEAFPACPPSLLLSTLPLSVSLSPPPSVFICFCVSWRRSERCDLLPLENRDSRDLEEILDSFSNDPQDYRLVVPSGDRPCSMHPPK